MQSGTGIQELMAAETRASQIVAEARIGESTRYSLTKERGKERQLFSHIPVVLYIVQINVHFYV
jgi:hypothetical protein